MSVESDRMLMLLQELAALKDTDERAPRKKAASKKRRAQIKREMKALAAQKKRSEEW
jgi:hypothetical protein